MNAMRDRLAPPLMPENPTQADLGAQTYYMVCMTCHGDRGQGLDDDFRSVLDPGDRNCWQSRCHAANHPEDGFVFPKIVPAVVTPTIPARFPTALDLYSYIKVRMPFQAPGSLTDEEYWQLTAFLVRANTDRALPVELTAETAASVVLNRTPSVPPFWVIGVVLGLILAGAALVFWLFRRRVFRRRTTSSGWRY